MEALPWVCVVVAAGVIAAAMVAIFRRNESGVDIIEALPNNVVGVRLRAQNGTRVRYETRGPQVVPTTGGVYVIPASGGGGTPPAPLPPAPPVPPVPPPAVPAPGLLQAAPGAAVIVSVPTGPPMWWIRWNNGGAFVAPVVAAPGTMVALPAIAAGLTVTVQISSDGTTWGPAATLLVA